LKRVHQKIVVSKFLAKAKEGERVQKDGGWGAGWKPRISGFFFLFFCLVFRVYFTESKFCFFSKRTAFPVFRNYIRLQGWSQFLKALTTYPV
jgi:hypothetical protein